MSSVVEQPQTTKKHGGRQPGRALRYAKGFARGLLHHPVGHYQHRLARPNHPWTDGPVERMNRTIKDAAVKRYHDDSHDQLRSHLADFLDACTFARRLKTLSGLTPYEYICKTWTSQPDRFIVDPIHQMPGTNTFRISALPCCTVSDLGQDHYGTAHGV